MDLRDFLSETVILPPSSMFMSSANISAGLLRLLSPMLMRVAEEMANDPSPSVMDNGFGTMQMSVSPAWADCGAMIIAAAKAIASSLNGFMAY